MADDTNAIQAAIDAANSRGGGTVVFPAGTFRIMGPRPEQAKGADERT